jgi:hypothetical protein
VRHSVLCHLGRGIVMADTRYHAVMLVRDESDIIVENLTAALKWADNIFIFDTGSTDGTWELINDLALTDSRVQPVERSAVVFNQILRAYLFHRVRPNFSDGDWVVKLDSDEFFHIAPPDFVREHLAADESCVWLQWYFFRLTSAEVDAYEQGQLDLLIDRRRSITDRRRYYKLPLHSEPRMFRYRETMKWSERGYFPHHAGFVAKTRIPIRHYPHRDPIQMQNRYALRSSMKRGGSPAGRHWINQDWRNDVIAWDGGSLADAYERSPDGVGLSAAAGHTDGPLYYWAPGTDLPFVRSQSHTGPAYRRLAQWTLHRWFARAADRLHSDLSPAYRPTSIRKNADE